MNTKNIRFSHSKSVDEIIRMICQSYGYLHYEERMPQLRMHDGERYFDITLQFSEAPEQSELSGLELTFYGYDPDEESTLYSMLQTMIASDNDVELHANR